MYFLDSEDFFLKQGQSGPLLCHGLGQLSVILFYSPHCVHSQRLIPLFKQLPNYIPGCQFGMLNASVNRRVVMYSLNTNTPIRYVPMILLYFNGVPLMRYADKYEMGSLRQFIMQAYNSVQSKMNIMQEDPHHIYKGNENIHFPPGGVHIPEYCIGKPLYGDHNKSYLEFEKLTD